MEPLHKGFSFESTLCLDNFVVRDFPSLRYIIMDLS